MKMVEIGKVAVSSEALRLRTLTRRQVRRVVYGVGALVFAVAAAVMLHVALFSIFELWLSPIASLFVVLALDAIGVITLAYFARSGSRDSVEVEALEVRQNVLAEMKASFNPVTLATELGGILLTNRVLAIVQRKLGLPGWAAASMLSLWARRQRAG